MSKIPLRIRQAVAERAAKQCEYCQLPVEGQVATFPVDHVVPESQSGPTSISNLALACPHCNSSKWACERDVDPVTGQVVALFNPRTQVWSEHFQWSRRNSLRLDGSTPCGRATVERLQINAPAMLEARRILRLARLKVGGR